MYQVLVEIATNTPRRAGYTEFTDFDPDKYRVDTYADRPDDLQVVKEASPEELINQARAQMLSTYLGAAIELRALFSGVITEINGLLDLKDYQLALLKAEAVDTSPITDTSLKDQADQLKAQFVGGLQALTQVG